MTKLDMTCIIYIYTYGMYVLVHMDGRQKQFLDIANVICRLFCQFVRITWDVKLYLATCVSIKAR